MRNTVLRTLPALGSCYGFEVRSALPFRYLREGGGAPLLVEPERSFPRQPRLLQSWPQLDGRRLAVRLSESRSSLVVEIGGSQRFTIGHAVDSRQPNGRELRIGLSGDLAPQLRERLLWTTPAAVAIVLNGDLALHAAAVEVDGHAFLLAGAGGAGKTSTSAAFHRAGFRVLADDLSCCRLTPDPVVLPGPALLRLDLDAGLRLLGTDPDERAGGEKPAWELPAARRGDGAPVGLRGIVLLQRGRGRPRLQRLTTAEAVQRLWQSNFHLPGEEHQSRTFQRFADLLGRCTAWELTRPRTWSCLPAVIECIRAEATP